MRHAALYSTLFAMLALPGGCSKQGNDNEAIRTSINERLSSLKTLNLDGMDMNIQNVSIQGNQAQAQVEFKPKTGSPQGAGMQVSYALEKQNGKWVVQTSKVAGGMIDHPAPGQNSDQNSTLPPSTTLPNFRDLVNSGAGSSRPPGQPPANSQGNMPPQ